SESLNLVCRVSQREEDARGVLSEERRGYQVGRRSARELERLANHFDSSRFGMLVLHQQVASQHLWMLENLVVILHRATRNTGGLEFFQPEGALAHGRGLFDLLDQEWQVFTALSVVSQARVVLHLLFAENLAEHLPGAGSGVSGDSDRAVLSF